jgi:hypothetical protein
MSTTTAVGVALVDDPLRTEAIAVAGFLAGYCGSTRRSYATDLRLFSAWCQDVDLPLFNVRRAHLELFGRWMEERGRMRSTVARRLSTLASVYKYCEQEQLIDRNPALNVRRPKVDYESRTLGLDRNELGAFLVQAGLGSLRDHALTSLLALNGLRISEALGADIDDLDFERGHRTLKIVRKGGKHVTIPLAPRTSRASTCTSASGRRGRSSSASRADGWTATPPIGPSSDSPGGPGSPSGSAHTASGTRSSPAHSTRELPSETSRRQPAMLIPARPCGTTGAGDHSTATPRTSWRRSWLGPPVDPRRR